MTISIHIGIPRTASTFLQTKVFPNLLDVQYFNSRSREVDSVRKALKGYELDSSEVSNVQRLRDKPGPSLLSAESLSMDPWTGNLLVDVSQVRALLGPVQGVIFLRHPTDWVMSLYSLAVQKNRFITIDEFTGYDGSSINKSSPPEDRKRHVNLESIRFSKLISSWLRAAPQTKVFFFENFLQNKAKTLEQLLTAIGSNHLPSEFELETRINASSKIPSTDTAVRLFNILAGNPFAPRAIRSPRYRVASSMAQFAFSRSISFKWTNQDESRATIMSLLDEFFSCEVKEIKRLCSDCPW